MEPAKPLRSEPCAELTWRRPWPSLEEADEKGGAGGSSLGGSDMGKLAALERMCCVDGVDPFDSRDDGR